MRRQTADGDETCRAAQPLRARRVSLFAEGRRAQKCDGRCSREMAHCFPPRDYRGGVECTGAACEPDGSAVKNAREIATRAAVGCLIGKDARVAEVAVAALFELLSSKVGS